MTTFVSQVSRARRRRSHARIVLTCGSAEGNLRNNHLMARTLERQGHDVDLSVVPGRHDWPSWHRAFDPHLLDLLAVTTPTTARDADDSAGSRVERSRDRWRATCKDRSR